MNHFKVASPRTNLEVEIAFTKAYRRILKKWRGNKYKIEAECMKAMY